MTYIVITEPLSKNGEYVFANFNKEAFEKMHNITLSDKPISVSVNVDSIILVFEEKQKPVKPKGSIAA